MVYVGNTDVCTVCERGYHFRCLAVQEGVAITQRGASFSQAVCKCDCWEILSAPAMRIPRETNLAAVDDYLKGEDSLTTVSSRHCITRKWLTRLVRRHRSRREFPDDEAICCECSLEFPREDMVALTESHWCCVPCTERR